MADTPRSSRYITPAEAADYLGLGLETIYQACKVGGLRHVRVNGKRNIRTTREWCDEWMEKDARAVTVPGGQKQDTHAATV
ncbi:MAG: excisionase family DNA-binding protein [Vicinamibacterales bacterium]